MLMLEATLLLNEGLDLLLKPGLCLLDIGLQSAGHALGNPGFDLLGVANSLRWT